MAIMKKKRGRPKGKKTEIVKTFKIGHKIIPISKTQAEKMRAILYPTERQRKIAKTKLRKMGLKIK
jgi:hypothetical protein